MRSWVVVGLAALLLAVSPSMVSAGTSHALVVEGAGSAGSRVQLDIDTLRELGTVSIETTTPWTTGVQQFVGVPLSRVLASAGLEGSTLRMEAVNGYRVEMPVADLEAQYPIVAFEWNGAIMPVRAKGPFWVIYPYDSSASYVTEAALARSIWQLVRVEVLP